MTTSKKGIHNTGVEYAAMKLIEQGISTISDNTQGTDLILNDGSTITVRALVEEMRDPVISGSLDNLKSDYVILVTNTRYTIKKFYIMTTKFVKSIAHLDITKDDDLDTYFIDVSKYRKYRDNYNILNR